MYKMLPLAQESRNSVTFFNLLRNPSCSVQSMFERFANIVAIFYSTEGLSGEFGQKITVWG